MNWIELKPHQNPPEGEIVMTKVDEFGDVRNEQKLIKKGSLWWTTDMQMYVYYTPTHWAYL